MLIAEQVFPRNFVPQSISLIGGAIIINTSTNLKTYFQLRTCNDSFGPKNTMVLAQKLQTFFPLS